jgi:hypothetical protein
MNLSGLSIRTNEYRPANVPQRYANQALHARYATHARTFFLSDFVSIENKGAVSQIPKLDVAGSIPARSNKSPNLIHPFILS